MLKARVKIFFLQLKQSGQAKLKKLKFFISKENLSSEILEFSLNEKLLISGARATFTFKTKNALFTKITGARWKRCRIDKGVIYYQLRPSTETITLKTFGIRGMDKKTLELSIKRSPIESVSYVSRIIKYFTNPFFSVFTQPIFFQAAPSKVKSLPLATTLTKPKLEKTTFYRPIKLHSYRFRPVLNPKINN